MEIEHSGNTRPSGGFDVCVVTYRNTATRVADRIRTSDRLYVHDNTSENLGFGAGANRAAAQGTGSLLLFVNPDGDLGPGALDALERCFQDPGVVAAEASQGSRWDRGQSPEWLSGACLAVSRRHFEHLGGFDERLFMYCEDVEISYRLGTLGALVHCSAATFDHDESESRGHMRLLHLNFRNWLTVQHWYSRAEPTRMLRDGMHDLRRRRFKSAATRISGTASYLLFTRRWSAPQAGSRPR